MPLCQGCISHFHIFFPVLTKDTSKHVKNWFDYITSHPVLRNNGFLKSFLTIVDYDEFKSFCDGVKVRSDFIEEMALEELWHMKVSAKSKVLHDMQISMAEIKEKYNTRAEIFLSVSDNLIKLSRPTEQPSEMGNICCLLKYKLSISWPILKLGIPNSPW